MSIYSLGLDFGTESVRALLVETSSGEEVAQEVFDYPHGVLDQSLPAGAELGPDWFMQHPGDYLEGLRAVVPAVIHSGNVAVEDVIGIGLDFTSCTLIPVDSAGTPLCMRDDYRDDPQAWVKLWKHHGGAAEAARIQEVGEKRGEPLMDYFAHAISSEWLLPKVLETYHRSREVYEAAWTFVEACDWIPWQLTGELKRNACCAGFKAMYNAELGGYPSKEFLDAIEEGFGAFFEEKMPGEIIPAGRKVGALTEDWAEELGLSPGIPISAGMIDAHMGVPGVGITEPGRMALVLGTSFCHMMLGETLKCGEGPLGIVQDGILADYYAYESGQSAGGDIYAWFVDNCVPPEIAAEGSGQNAHEILTEKARQLAPGESGLVALDWWNGNRSILMDAELSGLLVGATLNTKPEEMYRALIEATAFGTRRILEAYEDSGIEVRELVACGGLPEHNPFVVQLFADICGMPLPVAGTAQACALGSAMCGAAVAGEKAGGYESVADASARMAPALRGSFEPDPEASQVYDRLYAEYCNLYDLFGREEELMHRLRQIKSDVLNG
ncbi:MAG: ribulokinase [Candidatus Brocadiia bacterium]